MIFELAKPEDFEAVNRLAKQVSQHHAQWDKSIQLDEEDYPMDFFQDCIKEGAIYENAIYVARVDEKVVGFMRFTSGTPTALSPISVPCCRLMISAWKRNCVIRESDIRWWMP